MKTKYLPNEILDKSFNIEFKGYSAREVDSFLDEVIEDYQIFINEIQTLEAKLEKLNKELQSKDERILDLEAKSKFGDLSNTTSYSSIDLLKRVSRLEQEVFKK